MEGQRGWLHTGAGWVEAVVLRVDPSGAVVLMDPGGNVYMLATPFEKWKLAPQVKAACALVALMRS
tara:strand:- start:552 stop:749 length:198 start_codon:yes stop_codon:yes gene_type:complete